MSKLSNEMKSRSDDKQTKWNRYVEKEQKINQALKN